MDNQAYFTNSVGMRLIKIAPGSFLMGQDDGFIEERPRHPVKITKSFNIGVTPVTNAQYELFDPSHSQYRGKDGFSSEDDEAVLFVSWNDAVAYCKWLSEKEGEPYRLPTEAEWEYACRAGTDTLYSTGDSLPEEYFREQNENTIVVPVSLAVAKSPANPFGLHDMHGLAEEWCADWYAPYSSGEQTDPTGPADGEFKLCRGGSHNAHVVDLRSAFRAAAMPEDKHWLIGFRVVLGAVPAVSHSGVSQKPLWACGVSQNKYDWPKTKDAPFFLNPAPYIVPEGDLTRIPFYPHNHCPSITWCDNGDLLAIWFSCKRESGREMTVLASRLRRGASKWDVPSEFFKAPGRNMTGSALFNDEAGNILHANGLNTSYHWKYLAVTMRQSSDNAATFGRAYFANTNHAPRNQVISGMSKTPAGEILLPCDATYAGEGGSTVHLSRDGGKTWTEQSLGAPVVKMDDGATGPTIAGIHAGVVMRRDGTLLAYGRANSINEKMPVSISADMGNSWTYGASCFPPISSGQRLVLMRLREGPLLFISFTEKSSDFKNGAYDGTDSCNKYLFDDLESLKGLTTKDKNGDDVRIYGMYSALSYDDGGTWKHIKPLSPANCDRIEDGGAHTRSFRMSRTTAEPMGYLAATQSPDGAVHLISSRLYYSFNLAWLETPMD